MSRSRGHLAGLVLIVAASAGLWALAPGVQGQESGPAAGAPSQARPLVLEGRLEDEPITPTTARFIARAIEQAERDGAACLLIALDTPGGLVDSTRRIVKAMLASRTPIVVYVSPAGARAASAGLFITLAAHVAAMAPGTHIGAAHPVQFGGLPIAPPTEPAGAQRPAPSSAPASALEAKIVIDTVAWARALAAQRGRNREWAARAVRESASATAEEARDAQVVDLLAANLEELLARLDGRQVVLPQGPVTLHTAGAALRTLEMWWGDRLLAAIANPTVAFLLLVLGFYGVLFELYTPGWGVPGTLGVVCLVTAFFGLAILPVNYVGLLLIVVALALFAAEAFVTSHGLVAIGGAVCLVLGGLMLVDSPGGFMRVSLGVVLAVAAASGLISVFLLSNVVRVHRHAVSTGGEALLGAQALAQEDFAPRGELYAGTVLVHGELWQALSGTPVAAGQMLQVAGRDGLTLSVSLPGRPGAPASREAPA